MSSFYTFILFFQFLYKFCLFWRLARIGEKDYSSDMTTAQNYTNLSKYLSFLLRHHPEEANLDIDPNGWVSVNQLIENMNNSHRKKYHINREILEEIVRTDNKQRYMFDEDHTRIRACQGHSIPVDVELKEETPPDLLWHGTGEKSVKDILRQGLKKQNRLYVHLSPDDKTAYITGSRHGKPAVFEINTKAMAEDGLIFYRSQNNVWLTEYISPKYLKLTGKSSRNDENYRYEELLDLVDESGNPLGPVISRTMAHALGLHHRTSHVWIYRVMNNQPQVLIQKRSQNKDSHPGCWDISSAGHIPAGDDWKPSALRELKEELSIDANIDDLTECGIRHIDWNENFHDKPFHDVQTSKVFLLKKQDLDIRNLDIQASEIEEVRWIDYADLINQIQNHSLPNCIFLEELEMLKNGDEIFR